MRDKEFLNWIWHRLRDQHGENENVDYMHKLRSIIRSTDPEQETPNVCRAYNPELDCPLVEETLEQRASRLNNDFIKWANDNHASR